MTAVRATRPAERLPGQLKCIEHPSFRESDAQSRYGTDVDPGKGTYDDAYMPDEVTRECARQMHYAAWRSNRARSAAVARRWELRYYALRDRIVLGNRKLVYRAVRRRMAVSNRADDMIGDCHIVLIHAVAAYNPWMGIRFSTYAYTCLVRALSRLSQKLANDWLGRSMPLEALTDNESGGAIDDPVPNHFPRIDEFLRDDHPLLSRREKMILSQRFCLTERPGQQTLEKVGAALGLSKERVRQVQAGALDKLRQALSGEFEG